MKNLFMQNQLTAILLSICLIVPVANADTDLSDQASIEQVDVHRNRDVAMNKVSKSDEVLVTQVGDNNYASVNVNGTLNQLSLIQEGNANKGDIQLDGDRNKLSAVQNGDGLSFGLKIEGDNRTYSLTQERR